MAAAGLNGEKKKTILRIGTSENVIVYCRQGHGKPNICGNHLGSKSLCLKEKTSGMGIYKNLNLPC